MDVANDIINPNFIQQSGGFNTEWSKRDDEYSYSIIWGNGFPAPKGEGEEDDVMFSLSFKKGSRIISLSHGSW